MRNRGSWFSAFCIAILFFFLLTINAVAFTRIILFKTLRLDNGFTKRILSSASFNDFVIKPVDKTSVIDWSTLYPFSYRDDKIEFKKSNLLSRYYGFSMGVKEGIGRYSTDHFLGKNKFATINCYYEKAICWNYASPYSNRVIQTLDGSFIDPSSPVDVRQFAESVFDLSEFCKEYDVLTLYFNIPEKVCKYEDKDINNIVCLSNKNADDFLSLLDSLGVDNYDFRELLHKDYPSHHSLFYRTDFHWRQEIGRWAAQRIAEVLNNNYTFDFDTSLLDVERFSMKSYRGLYPGYYGRRGLVLDPDDFLFVKPNYRTEFHYEIKNLGIDQIGNFLIFYDYEKFHIYGMYDCIHGNQPLERIENREVTNQNRVLIIHDSFGNSVVPFFALCCRYVDSIDLRSFNGSVQNFILTEKPDVVIVTYNSRVFYYFDAHEQFFDFR